MAVAFDASSESHTGTTGSTNEASYSWTHTPVGTPRGVIVYAIAHDHLAVISGVTYGGVALAFSQGTSDISGETAITGEWFLGASIPTGAQTITVTRTNNAVVHYAFAATVTAASDTAATGGVALFDDGTLAEQSVDDGSPGTNSLRFAAIASGLSAIVDNPTTPGSNNLSRGTNSTMLQSIDLGQRVSAFVRETTAGQGSRSVGFSASTSDDRAALHVAIKELPAATGFTGWGIPIR